MNGNPLENDGGMAVAEMLNINRVIKSLDLGNTELGTESLVALCTVLYGNMVLCELNLENPRLFGVQQETTMHIGRMLAVNTGLESLNLGAYCGGNIYVCGVCV